METTDPEETGLNSIPTSKVKRAAKIIGTGAKVGGNYLKYYAKKSINPSLSKTTLHEDNAADIYQSLSEMKGSALKVAQMMSMDNQVLPKAYQDKFSMAQYNAPPLSYPLILKTFQQFFGKKPLGSLGKSKTKRPTNQDHFVHDVQREIVFDSRKKMESKRLFIERLCPRGIV